MNPHSPAPASSLQQLTELMIGRHQLNNRYEEQCASAQGDGLDGINKAFSEEVDRYFFRYSRLLQKLGLEIGSSPDTLGESNLRFDRRLTLTVQDGDRLLDFLRELNPERLDLAAKLGLSGLLMDLNAQCSIHFEVADLDGERSPTVEMFSALLTEVKRLDIDIPGTKLAELFECRVVAHREGFHSAFRAMRGMETTDNPPSTWHLQQPSWDYEEGWILILELAEAFSVSPATHVLKERFHSYVTREIALAEHNLSQPEAAAAPSELSEYRRILDEQRDRLNAL